MEHQHYMSVPQERKPELSYSDYVKWSYGKNRSYLNAHLISSEKWELFDKETQYVSSRSARNDDVKDIYLAIEKEVTKSMQVIVFCDWHVGSDIDIIVELRRSIVLVKRSGQFNT